MLPFGGKSEIIRFAQLSYANLCVVLLPVSVFIWDDVYLCVGFAGYSRRCRLPPERHLPDDTQFSEIEWVVDELLGTRGAVPPWRLWRGLQIRQSRRGARDGQSAGTSGCRLRLHVPSWRPAGCLRGGWTPTTRGLLSGFLSRRLPCCLLQIRSDGPHGIAEEYVGFVGC